ncbi:MAG: VWA domain-containing protein [Armatimonadota bacterium]|nr:VWA domain-containing protein [Armatimonadota bacterium]
MNSLSPKPVIEILTSRSAVCNEAPIELDVLIRVTPPPAPQNLERPPLNLGLVLDRSGSMQGDKLEAAKAAASYAVEQLLPTDRVSVTVYDSDVQTIVPSTLAQNKSAILRSIRAVQVGSSTALHAGWVEGGLQVSQHLNPAHLNRVIVLTDGLANVGETNPDRIATDVHGLARRGVCTTTMGVGSDYNEDLLEAMARSGDGNYYFIESAGQLPHIFAAELQGLAATAGHTVSLGIEPQSGVEVVEVLTQLDRNKMGRLQLPNLVSGQPLEVILKISVPLWTGSGNLCLFRLAWSAAQEKERQVLRSTLVLPSVSLREWEEMPQNGEVKDYVARLEVDRIRQQAIEEMRRGDYAAAQGRVAAAQAYVVAAMPASPMRMTEVQELETLQRQLAEGESMVAEKEAKFQSYRKHRSR